MIVVFLLWFRRVIYMLFLWIHSDRFPKLHWIDFFFFLNQSSVLSKCTLSRTKQISDRYPSVTAGDKMAKLTMRCRGHFFKLSRKCRRYKRSQISSVLSKGSDRLYCKAWQTGTLSLFLPLELGQYVQLRICHLWWATSFLLYGVYI